MRFPTKLVELVGAAADPFKQVLRWSWHRSDLQEALPHSIAHLRETVRTVGVRERELSWIHAMGFAIRPLCDPELTTRGKSCIVSNESTGATHGEQRWWNERLLPRSGRYLTSGPHNGSFCRHDRSPCARRRFSVCRTGRSTTMCALGMTPSWS